MRCNFLFPFRTLDKIIHCVQTTRFRSTMTNPHFIHLTERSLVSTEKYYESDILLRRVLCLARGNFFASKITQKQYFCSNKLKLLYGNFIHLLYIIHSLVFVNKIHSITNCVKIQLVMNSCVAFGFGSSCADLYTGSQFDTGVK